MRELGTPTHIGGNGQGLVLKLAINISLAVQTLAFREGVLLAEHEGVDPRPRRQGDGRSSIGSPMLKARVPLILDLPDEAWFDVGLMHKDIRLAREAGAEHGTRSPPPASPTRCLPKASDSATPTATSRPSTTSSQAYQTIPLPSHREQSRAVLASHPQE